MQLNDIKILPYQMKLEQLFVRTPRNHKQYKLIENQLLRERAGFFGESQIIYPLKKWKSPHYSVHQIRLPLHTNFFQIDTFILTPRYGIIIEAKNYAGEVTFSNDFNQVIQRKEEAEQVYTDPVIQVQEQKYQLELWLQQHNYSDIPILPLVVMTNPRSLLKTSDRDYYKKRIISLPRLSSRLREIDEHFKREVISMGEALTLGKLMLKENKPYNPDILNRMKVERDELISGIVCYECGSLSVRRINRSWECVQCGIRDRKAHINALKDYYLLCGDKLTNHDFRRFTGLESEHAAKNLLSRAGLRHSGKTTARVYHLDYNYNVDFNYIEKLQKLNPIVKHRGEY